MESFKIQLSVLFGFLTVIGLGAQTLAGYTTSTTTFSTYQEQMAGETAFDYVHLQFNDITYNLNVPNWTVKVRALSNFVNQTNPAISIPIQYFSLQFNDVNRNPMAPSNQNPIQLGTSQTLLISGCPPLTASSTGYYLVYDYDLIIQGGTHLLVQNGNYETSLEFSLYDGSGNLIDSSVLNNVYFTIQTQGSGGGSSLVLQNSANVASFQFDDVNDYFSGISIDKPLGLKVVSYQDYEVIVKASGTHLTSVTTTHTIPVSVIKLEVDQTQESLPNLVMASSTALSNSDQTVIQNPLTNYTYQEVEYDLRYFILPSSKDEIMGPAATYGTQAYFILIPQ